MTHSTDSGLTAVGGARRRWRRVLARLLVVALAVGIILAAQFGQLTNTRVRTGAFHFHWDGSVSIDGLVLQPLANEPRYDNTILRAKNVSVRVDRWSLLRLSPRLTEIGLQNFLLDAQMDLDTGRWNVSDLRFRGRRGGGGPLPALRLQKGRLRYAQVSGGKVEVVASVPVEASFARDEQPDGGYRFALQTSTLAGGRGESRLSGRWRPGELTLTGGWSATDIPSLVRVWAVGVLAGELKYDPRGAYTLDLRLKDVHGTQAPQIDALRLLTPEARAGLGPLVALQRFFSEYQPTGKVESIRINAGGDFGKLRDSTITGKLVCTDVSICDSEFPYPLDHVKGEIDFTESMVLVNGLQGKHGPVDVSIEGWAKGFGRGQQYQCRITSGNMVLDPALYAALSAREKRLWDLFRPSGVVAADYRQMRTSPTDRRRYLAVELNGVAATCREFPYPLTGLTGKLFFDRESITATDLVSCVGAGRIRINAKVTSPNAPVPAYHVSIDANDLPLDAVLGAALPPSQRRMYQQFEARGVANVHARVFNTDDVNNIGPPNFLADLTCDLKSVKLTQPSLVLSNVTAEAALTPDSLAIKRLSGRWGDSPVALAGRVRLAEDDKPSPYHLRLTADGVPLNEETVALLPEPLGKRVAAFRPRGSVNLTADLQRTDSNEPVDYRVVVQCLGDEIDHEQFAYPLRDVRGTITATNDSLTLKDVTAHPDLESARPVVGWVLNPPSAAGMGGDAWVEDPAYGPNAAGTDRAVAPGEASPAGSPAAVQIDGSATLAGAGIAKGVFTLRARDLLFTRALGDALPKDLAAAYRDLSPQGPFDLEQIVLNVSGAGEGALLVEFNATAGLRACQMNVSGTAAEWRGTVRAAGSYHTGVGLTGGRARLAAEKFVVRGKPVADLAIDAIYDPNTRKWATENFTGVCCGGTVLGNLEVAKTEPGGLQYLLRVVLSRVDLAQFLGAGKLDDPAETRYSTGTMNASLSLAGGVGDGAVRRGICQIDVGNMQVGKVSPLAKLLSVLRLTEPTDYTFERMLINSYIKKDKLLIRTFDMSGRNVAFTGAGTMDLPTEEVDLSLTARGHRLATAEPSLLQSLTEGLGGAVVRIEVTGSAGNPHIETKALPVLGDSLRILSAGE
jgi:hypothetical protein